MDLDQALYDLNLLRLQNWMYNQLCDNPLRTLLFSTKQLLDNCVLHSVGSQKCMDTLLSDLAFSYSQPEFQLWFICTLVYKGTSILSPFGLKKKQPTPHSLFKLSINNSGVLSKI